MASELGVWVGVDEDVIAFLVKTSFDTFFARFPGMIMPDEQLDYSSRQRP